MVHGFYYRVTQSFVVCHYLELPLLTAAGMQYSVQTMVVIVDEVKSSLRDHMAAWYGRLQCDCRSQKSHQGEAGG
jgi:hypothetical protein